MKMNRKSVISKSLYEVLQWKEAVYKDIKDKTFKEKKAYYHEGLREAAKIINGKLIRNADGTYSLKA
ncbi:MAG: hypothetical protein WCQ99_01350 [Pseudomonadota bacterium]